MFGASWKTTVFGLMAAIGGAVLAGITTGMIDVTHLPAWLKGAAGLLSTIGAAGLGLSARDNKVTSEEANAGKSGSGGGFTSLLLFGALALFALVGCLLFAGCGHATLEAGGAYAPVDTNGVAQVQPDFEFFAADSGFDLSMSTIDGIFKFERDNRLMLWKLSPDIKHGLDKLRPEVVAVGREYGVARQAYMANPVPTNLSTLQEVLAKGKQLMATVQAAMPPGVMAKQ